MVKEQLWINNLAPLIEELARSDLGMSILIINQLFSPKQTILYFAKKILDKHQFI